MKKHLIWRSGACVLLAIFLFTGSLLPAAWNGEAADRQNVGYQPAEAAKPVEGAWENITVLSNYTEVGELQEWYCIDSAEGLCLFAKLVNLGTGYSKFRHLSVYLGADIDLSGVTDFTPIGSGATNFASGLPSTAFNGKFNGCGYQIDGLQLTTQTPSKPTNMRYASLFGCVGATAQISNLVIGEACSFRATEDSPYTCTAALASRVVEGALIQNVISLADVSGGYYAGGLIARLDNNSRSQNSIVTASVINCTNSGNVQGSGCVGGLIGSVRGSMTLTDSDNYGNIKVTNESGEGIASCIIGQVDEAIAYSSWSENLSNAQKKVTVNLLNVYNYGNLAGRSISGAMVGDAANNGIDESAIVYLSLSNCSNSGTVLTEEAGLVGRSDEAVPQSNCVDRSAAVRFHGSQVRTAGERTNTYAVRFVGSVGDLEYTELGFRIRIEWNGRVSEKTLKCKTVFQNLGAENAVVYTAEELRGSENAYLYALTLKDIPLNSGKVIFHITPYGIRKGADDAELGEAFDMVYENGSFLPAWTRNEAAA